MPEPLGPNAVRPSAPSIRGFRRAGRVRHAPRARPGAQRLAGGRGAGRRGDRARDGERPAGRGHRLQPADHRPRPDRARRDRRPAPRRDAAGELPAAGVRALRDARAVRDVRDGAAARARQAGGLRRDRSEGRRRRIGDRRVRQRRRSTTTPRSSAACSPREAGEVLRSFFAERREQYRQRRAAPTVLVEADAGRAGAGHSRGRIARDRRRARAS